MQTETEFQRIADEIDLKLNGKYRLDIILENEFLLAEVINVKTEKTIIKVVGKNEDELFKNLKSEWEKLSQKH